jgi:phage shock protein A
MANCKRKSKKRPMKKLRRERDIVEKLEKQESELRHDLKYTHKHLDKLWEHVSVTNVRLAAMEAQLNMLSRLVTTLCIEKMGIKLKSFRRLIQRLEKEAIADSEIRDLQDLYEMETHRD